MPYRLWLLLLFAAAFAIAAIDVTNRRDWVLEHSPTLVLLVYLMWYERRRGGRPLSRTSYTLLFAFLLLHVVGAHYLYSNVPYREWAAALCGELPAWLATERNHYDRFVHLCFGLLLLMPIAEMVHRHVTPRRGWTVLVGIAFVGFLSKVYELLEWAFALFLSPDAAEAYNGQQGDIWDAHKDMALALLGTFVSLPFVAWKLVVDDRLAGRPTGTTRGPRTDQDTG